MAEHIPLWVEYPADDPAMPPVVVERLAPAAVDDDLSRGAIRLLRDSYIAQYGGRTAPASAFRQTYDPNNEQLVQDNQRAIEERAAGGHYNYWVARGAQNDRLEGMVATACLRQGVYLHNIAVSPPWKRGVGSRLLHAALTQDGLDSKSLVHLDGFEGSSVNEWYKSLGFMACYADGRYEIGATGYSVLMRQFVTPVTVGVGGVVRALERKRPQLALAKVRQTAY